MKSVIKTKPKEEKESVYPRLEESSVTGAVYLVTKLGYGICVFAKGSISLGSTHSGGLARDLKPFKEKVVLEN